MRALTRHLASLFNACVLLLGAAGAEAAIVNKASATWNDPALGIQRQQSNTVTAVLPELITYYTDASYTAQARVTSAASLLYVQALAPSCNADPLVAETITIKISASRAGDAESFSATETAPDSGVFRTTPGFQETSAATTPAAARSVTKMGTTSAGVDDPEENSAAGSSAADGALRAMKNDTLTASIASCGDNSAWASILVDPSGVVFDAASNAPVAGARVSLIDVSGAGNGGVAGGPARVYAHDGVTPLPSSVVTDASGVYSFPLVAPSLYRLAVEAPASYAFPTKTAPGALPASRDIHLYGSFGGVFTVSADMGPVAIDLPVDAKPGVLYLEKTASRANAEVGDVVDYTIRVHNTADEALASVVVDDDLPAGFRYQAGTLRVDGAPIEPAGGAGPALRIAVGDLPALSSIVVRYRVRVGAGALNGDGINRARASSAAPRALTNGVAAAKVKVDAGLFADKGFVVGQVFADCDGNGLRSEKEAGIPGVRIWLEDGSFAQTDLDGRYSFADLAPRTHAARLDQLTLPQGAQLAAGGEASRFVDLQDGQLGKADFAVDACSPQLQNAIGARRATLQASSAAAERAALAAPIAAAADFSKMDNSLGFVGLADGAVLPQALATVRVKGTAGARFELLVDGKPVGEQRIGQRSTVAERQLESWEFVGVALQPGRNRLEVRQFDSFGNARGASSLTVVAPGAAKVLRLEIDRPTQAADGRSFSMVRVRIEDAAGVPVADRTPVSLSSSRGAWEAADLDPREAGLQVFVEGGSAEFALRAPSEAGDATVLAASGALRGEAAINYVPAQRPLLATGMIDAAVGLGRSSGNTVRPSRTFDSLDDTLRGLSAGLEDRHAAAGGSAAVFMKGTVAKDTLLTMSYDSDKPKQDGERRLFRDLSPDAYYPTYGDDAVRGFEAQSAGRLYLRAERNKSYVSYGDFTPPNANPARKLGAYQRSLTGLRQHLETGGLVLDSFASYDSTRQLVEEVAANGTSGPYLTGSGAMVINSERIEIVTRERNRDGVIVASRPLVRYVDYDIEPLTGRILLRAPVASLDADLNPQYLRISYEVDQGNPNFWVAGINAQYRVNRFLEVGAGVATDRNPAQTQTLSSVNATVKPDEKTTVTVEAAQLDRAGQELGRAARIDAVRADGKLETRVFYGRADENFDNPSANLPRGRTDGGARLRYRVGERATVDLEALHTADALTGAERNGVMVGGGYALTKGVRVEAGVRHAREAAAGGTVVAQPDLTSVRVKVAAQVPNLPQAGVFVEAEQDIKDAGRRMVALGGDYRFAGGSRAYARHELISSLGSNYALNDGQQRNATVIGLDSDYMQNGRVFSEYRARAGGSDGGLGERQAEAAIGLRNLWQVAEGVRAHTSFERVRVLSGSQANEAVAVTGAVEISRNPVWKGTARLELRHAADSDNLLSTLGLARRLDAEWSLLAKNTVSATRSRANDALRLNELLQGGVAFRALETLGWNGLAKYEYKLERDTGAEQVERAVHMVAANANWQPTRETLFSARIAAKLARDRSLGLDSRNSAQLIGLRATRTIAADWDVGASAQVLLDGGAAKGRQFGAGVEAGYRLRQDMWVSAGYNLLGFRERDLAGADATQKGVYLRLRIKFDERLLEGLLAPKK